MALTQADVLAGIKEIVEEVAGIPAASIEMDKNFTDDLDVDSLSMVEVVVGRRAFRSENSRRSGF